MADDQPPASSGVRRLRKRTQALIVVVVAPLLALAGLGTTYLQRLPEPADEAEPTLEEVLADIPGVVSAVDDAVPHGSVTLTVTDIGAADDVALVALPLAESRRPATDVLQVVIAGDPRTDWGGSISWDLSGGPVDPARVRERIELWDALVGVERTGSVSFLPGGDDSFTVYGMPGYRPDRTIATSDELQTAWEAVLAEHESDATLQVLGP